MDQIKLQPLVLVKTHKHLRFSKFPGVHIKISSSVGENLKNGRTV